MNLIVAVDNDFGIGKNGIIPWRIKEDMAFFRKETINKTIIMGRKTLDSFRDGKPLKDRVNIVITKDASFSREGVIIAHCINDVLDLTRDIDSDDVYIIGGGSIYRLFEPVCRYAYVTKVKDTFNCDTFFPDLDKAAEWKLIEEGENILTESGHNISFCKYERRFYD